MNLQAANKVVEDNIDGHNDVVHYNAEYAILFYMRGQNYTF